MIDNVFSSSRDILRWVEGVKPDFQHAESELADYHDGPWFVDGHYNIMVDTDKIQFAIGNNFNIAHAVAISIMMREGSSFNPPIARAYVINEIDVKSSIDHRSEGNLEYQLNMNRAWRRYEIGSVHVDLRNGNHRALAAMINGYRKIPVYVLPNHRESIPKEVWL